MSMTATRYRYQGYFPCTVALVLISGGSIAQAQTTEPRVSAQVSYAPLSRFVPGSLSQSPVVGAKISGRNYQFLLDTGAVISLVKQSAATESRLSLIEAPSLKEDKELAQMLRIGGKVQGMQVPTLELGRAAIPDVFLHVAPEPVLNLLTRSEPSFAGILGANLLRDTAVYFDPEKKEVTLFLKGKLTTEERNKIGFEDDKVAIAALQSARTIPDQFLVEVICNERPVRLFLDTGAEHTYIHKPLSDFGISPRETTEFRTKSIYGDTKAFAAPATLSLGKSNASAVTVHFEKGDGSEGDGLLGMDFLSRYHVLMDFPARKIYLRGLR